MCDYSLHNVESRPARVADELISTRFRTSITRGFAAANEPDIAVCLLPGTEVAFQGDVEMDPGFPLFRKRNIRQRVARFRQIDLDQPHSHHDALEFPDGQIVLVTSLVEGQRITVLQLPTTERSREQTDTSPQQAAETFG